jgi:hypothetical protein
MHSIEIACLQLQAGMRPAAAETRNGNYFVCLIR